MYIVKKQSQDEATVKSDELQSSKRAALNTSKTHELKTPNRLRLEQFFVPSHLQLGKT